MKPSIPNPPHSGPVTSRRAAGAKVSTAATEREKVLAYLIQQGYCGATDEEIQLAIPMDGNTERPRRWELLQAGQVIDSGRTRATSSGQAAIIWLAPDFASSAIPRKETRTVALERTLREIREVLGIQQQVPGVERTALRRIQEICEAVV